MKQTLKSIAAVVAGLLASLILSTATDTILELTGVYPSFAYQRVHGFHTTWMVTLALVYRTAYAVLAGYLTARLAPARPQKHALILALIGTAVGIAGIFAAGHLAPLWYSIAIPVLGLPAVLIGARLYRPRTKAADREFA